jgi:hypothetical protein
MAPPIMWYLCFFFQKYGQKNLIQGKESLKILLSSLINVFLLSKKPVPLEDELGHGPICEITNRKYNVYGKFATYRTYLEFRDGFHELSRQFNRVSQVIDMSD